MLKCRNTFLLRMSRPPKQASISPARRKQNTETQFPGKLHDMMTYVYKNQLEHIISWVQNGTAFIIHDTARLTEILPLFFGQTKYRSFRRQLNMWHFERLSTGPNQGAFVHPFFMKGKKHLCSYMSRHIDPKELQPSPMSQDSASDDRWDQSSAFEPSSIQQANFGMISDGGDGGKNMDSSPANINNKSSSKSSFSSEEVKKQEMILSTDIKKDIAADDEDNFGHDSFSSNSSTSTGNSFLYFLNEKGAGSDVSAEKINAETNKNSISSEATVKDEGHIASVSKVTRLLLENIYPGITEPASPQMVELVFNEFSSEYYEFDPFR